MLGEGFQATTDSLRGQSHVFGDAGADLVMALQRCRQALDGLGDMCGKDEAGAKVAAYFYPMREAIERGLETKLIPGLGGISAALVDIALNYEDLDQVDQAAVFQGLRLDS